MLKKIDKFSNKQAAVCLFVIGIIVFAWGLGNPFEGDDLYQIVLNTPVHSIAHLFQFFNSSTFYNGYKLTGVYYRPLMTTVFSVIYSIFGPHPVAFHIFQLIIYLSSSFLLYLIFRQFLKPAVSLILATLFLIHPMNSQVVYAIPSMQDALFFFFGLLGLWFLVSRKDNRGLIYAAICLFASLLSKETGVIFIVIMLAYLYLFDRQRIVKFTKIIILPIAAYLALKISAVGLNSAQNGSPIDNLKLGSRLMTDPSIIAFYLTKFVYPVKLATGYYWVYPHFSIRHVLLPLIIDLLVIAFFIWLGFLIKHKLKKQLFHAYIFFAIFAVVGILPYLQIIPLDLTACEDWFYPSMAGIFGMIGIGLLALGKLKPTRLIFKKEYAGIAIALLVVLIAVLGIRTAIRSRDYSSQYKLALSDNASSPDDTSAMNDIAEGLIVHKDYGQAIYYASKSAQIYPTVSNYDNLGVAEELTGNYTAAFNNFNAALKYGSLNIVYENLADIYLVYKPPAQTKLFLEKAINNYPNDYKIWLDIALFEQAIGDHAQSVKAIDNAIKFGPIPKELSTLIKSNQPFSLSILGKTVVF